MKAEKSGLVIYSTARPWEYVPEIEEGATVYMGQTMLLMPDLARMQVKINIHESFIDRMRPKLAAQVSLPDRTLAGEVSSVASVAEPAGEWNGYVGFYSLSLQSEMSFMYATLNIAMKYFKVYNTNRVKKQSSVVWLSRYWMVDV
ncbi:MAG: hypothetical protein H8D56_22395 [Planctomycetes bacterium]|nr:hypothetical protein [Planctomycetota bacterium]